MARWATIPSRQDAQLLLAAALLAYFGRDAARWLVQRAISRIRGPPRRALPARSSRTSAVRPARRPLLYCMRESEAPRVCRRRWEGPPTSPSDSKLRWTTSAPQTSTLTMKRWEFKQCATSAAHGSYQPRAGGAQKLELYALFKQANFGPCSGGAPSIANFVARAKWCVDQACTVRPACSVDDTAARPGTRGASSAPPLRRTQCARTSVLSIGCFRAGGAKVLLGVEGKAGRRRKPSRNSARSARPASP